MSAAVVSPAPVVASVTAPAQVSPVTAAEPVAPASVVLPAAQMACVPATSTYTMPTYSWPTATSVVTYPVSSSTTLVTRDGSYMQPAYTQPLASAPSTIAYPVTKTYTLVTKDPVAQITTTEPTEPKVAATKTATKTKAKKVSKKKNGCC